MAVDSRFSEFCDDVLIDIHPSIPSSFPYPNLTGDDLLLDLSSQDVSFPLNGPAHVGVNHILPVSVASDGELIVPSVARSAPGEIPPKVQNGFSGSSPGEESSSSSDDITDSSNAALQYINQMLMEEDMEENPWFFSNQLALRNTEKSLYDAVGEKYPQSPGQTIEFDVGRLRENPSLSCIFPGTGGDLTSSGASDGGFSLSKSAGPNLSRGAAEFGPDHALRTASSFSDKIAQQCTEVVPKSTHRTIDGSNKLAHSSATELLDLDILNNNDFVLQFKKGLEEASKFLPSSTQLFKNLDNSGFLPEMQVGIASANAKGSNNSKNHVRDDTWVEEERACKQTAVSSYDSELSEMFDRVLLCNKDEFSDDNSQGAALSKDSKPQGKTHTSKGSKDRAKKRKNNNPVDLRNLLVTCAQAVAAHDFRTANELLKLIRENSSPIGDGSQRLAHYFANGLEARMTGNGGQTVSFFTSPTIKKISAADMLKSFHAYLTACPFTKFPIFFAGYMISEMAATAKVLHIIDFGICFGFHWPIVIQNLSKRPIGPPKLRITGIEFPVPGFRPAQRIEETGHLLAQYCDRFGVPFEYNAVASWDWESIKIGDLKIRSDEMIAVHCLNRFKSLLNGMDEDDSPRDSMLKLVKRIKPDLFVDSISHGSYNSPFFITRFREALFHLSAVFDMLDITLSRESTERQLIEREYHGRDIINVIACEGSERIERPESYKRWQSRHLRAGFKQLPLDQKLLMKFRSKIHEWYHKDFTIDEDNNWMLLGWRGRIMNASACWVPSYDDTSRLSG